MPSFRSPKLRSPDSGNGLKNKELHRLLNLSNGNFILGNKNAKKESTSFMNDKNGSPANEDDLVTSSVSQLLASSRDKRRSRRSDRSKNSSENESMMSTSSSITSELMDKRGRDILKKTKNRRSGRSKSSVRSSSSSKNSRSRRSRSNSVEKQDVNIAAAQSLGLRRSSSLTNMSLSGQSVYSSAGRSRRSKSALKARKDRHEGGSPEGGKSALSSQLSMISNLEEFSELDATVLSASEGNDRIKYSRRSSKSSRSSSRQKGSRTSRSHRRRINSSGSVYSTDSKSVQDILSELKSTASAPTYIRHSSTGRSGRSGRKMKQSSVDQSETLLELLRQSRDVLKEASDFRVSREQAQSSAPPSSPTSTSISSSTTKSTTKLRKPALLGRSKSDTPSRSKDSISTTYSPDLDTKPSDLISRAEHSFLDDLVKSVDPTDISREVSKPIPSSPKNYVKNRVSSFDKNKNSQKSATFDQFSTLDWDDDDFNSSKEATNHVDINSFGNEPSFSTSFCDSTMSENSEMKNHMESPESEVTTNDYEHKIQTVKTRLFPISSKEKESDGIGINPAMDESTDKNIDSFESFSTVFDPWPDEMIEKKNTEALNTSDPLSLESSFGDGWNSSQDLISDSFHPFTDEQSPDPDKTFMTHEDSRNVSVLSYSKGESMIDFFGDMNLEDFTDELKPMNKKKVEAPESKSHDFMRGSHVPVKSQPTDEESDDGSFQPMFALENVTAEACDFESHTTSKCDEDFDLQMSPTDEYENEFDVYQGERQSNNNKNCELPFSQSSQVKSTFGKVSSIKTTELIKKDRIISSESHGKSSNNNGGKKNPRRGPRMVQFADAVTSKEIPSRADQVEFELSFSADWDEPSNGDFETNDSKVEEKANFMMGFLSEFPNNSFDAWESTDNIDFDGNFKNKDDELDEFEGGKRLSFGSCSQENTEESLLQKDSSFDPFETSEEVDFPIEPNQNTFFAEFDESNNFDDPPPKREKQSTSKFFEEKVVFEESFGSTNFFDNTRNAPRKFRQNAVEWDSQDDRVTSFDPWFDDWGKKTDSSGRDSINAAVSITEFSTGTTESPSSVIQQERIFVK